DPHPRRRRRHPADPARRGGVFAAALREALLDGARALAAASRRIGPTWRWSWSGSAPAATSTPPR
ncbi:hypothetical protein, partial [Actinomyces ruminis]|uniref:hypothetical protein n=1 Tax=Actinomyces ruminis TaxID=1937003 RepID=UPI001C55722F